MKEITIRELVCDAIRTANNPVDFNYVVNEIKQIDDQTSEFHIKCEIWKLISNGNIILDNDRNLLWYKKV